MSFLKLVILFVFLTLASNQAFAAGVMQLRGKIVGFSSSEVTLEVRKKLLYIIDRTKLSAKQSAAIKTPGQEVTMSVPMPAVKNVKTLK